MKRFIPILLILLVCGTACSALGEDTDNGTLPGNNTVFYATLEKTGIQQETKVYADANLKVLWNADDRVCVFNKCTDNEEYRCDGNTGDDSGTFSRIGNEVSGSNLQHVYSVYPYSSSTTINAQGTLSLTLPAVQTYKLNSFDSGTNTMVSVTDDDQLQFYNAGGYLALKLYGAGISVSKITLHGSKSEKLAGPAAITILPGETPSVSMAESAADMVELVCDPPVQLAASRNQYTVFWFVIPPTTFSEGFTVNITVAQGDTDEKSTSKSITISRNTLVKMAPLELTQDGIVNHQYGDDDNWDPNTNFGGDLNNDGYGGDHNWDPNTNSSASLNHNGYNGDSNWDSNSSSGTSFNNNGYGNDTGFCRG